MVVKIRFNYGSALRKTASANRHAALVMSSLMTPIAVMAWALGCWRIAADLKWTGEFAIAQGIFSHWQVWIAMAVGVQFAAFLLHRYGRGDNYRDDDAALS
jgi:hypothetical protein